MAYNDCFNLRTCNPSYSDALGWLSQQAYLVYPGTQAPWNVGSRKNSGDTGGYDRTNRLGGISAAALSQTSTLEYSLPNPDMSRHISSTTTSLHEIRSHGVELDDETDVTQETNGKVLNPLAVHLPSDENSQDLVSNYCKSFGSDPSALNLLPRREPSSTFVYSPSLGKDSTTGLYPFANHSVAPSQSPPLRHNLVPSDIGPVPQSTVRLIPSDDGGNQALCLGSTSSRSTRSIVDHLTSTVLQFRKQHQQRMNLVASETTVEPAKMSASSPGEAASSALRVSAQRNQRLSEFSGSKSDEVNDVFSTPSSSPPLQPTHPTRTIQSSAYQAYPLPSSCKPASSEFAWHNQSSQQLQQQQQQQRLLHTHTHPKQRYVKSNDSPSILDSSSQFGTPGGNGGQTPTYCDLSPHSVNGNSDHSPPAVTAALCAAAADVTSSTSTSAPWFTAAAAAAAKTNVLMVASQAPSSCSSTRSFADAYAIYSTGNGCQAESSHAQPSQHIFGRIPSTPSADAPVVYESLERRPTVSLPNSRKECDPVGCTKNGTGALFVTVQDFTVGIQHAAKYMISERKNPQQPTTCLSTDAIFGSRRGCVESNDASFRIALSVHFGSLCHVSLNVLELIRDYVNGDSTQYNYFDFTEEEREVIFGHFPTFHTIIGHLIRSGEFLHRIRLDNIELVFVCAQEVFKSQPGLVDSASVDHLFTLASRALTNHVIVNGQPLEERSSMLRPVSPLLEEMNMENHQVIAQLRLDKPQLDFPELYTEMFQLSEAKEGGHLEHAALMQSTESRS
ncbi:Nuclear receptor 2DBD-beta [Fasciolopsis buskii]|uniref:Nuclear receptor 2DBD-beta n=1 Tax=Fasciolopsis buskii TaxID=27845 RepID=A0A8E0S0F4_9TREM|nr:Nuclear receptor 2DBD-beta [Fasciolopsis buski]